MKGNSDITYRKEENPELKGLIGQKREKSIILVILAVLITLCSAENTRKNQNKR